MPTLRLIVAGSRHLPGTAYDLVRATLDRLLANRLPDIVILSGAAPGADSLGERYAQENGLACERYPADWEQFGKAAGPRRNAMMARRADACVLFDGGGPGSRSMASEARRAVLDLRVIDVRHLLP